MGKMRLPFIDSDCNCYIGVSFKAVLTVLVFLLTVCEYNTGPIATGQ